METWLEYPLNPNYLVSDHGRIKNKFGNILFVRFTKKGYPNVRLMRGEPIPRNVVIHRMVCITFISNEKNLPQVNHKDGDKLNNHVSNLEWCTNLENMRHAAINGLRPDLRGSKHGRAGITEEQAIQIREAKGITRKELMEMFGVSIHVIKDIRSNRSWTHIYESRH